MGEALPQPLESAENSKSRDQSVCENSVLEGHGFSRAVNDIAIRGFHGKPGQVSR
jgi:hypothetical protein